MKTVAVKQTVTAADFPHGRWHARWIWCGQGAIDVRNMVRAELDETRFDRYVMFRRTFTLDDVPTRVPARITADSRYVLWVNGTEVSRGPVRCNFLRLHYDPVDLAPALARGENTIAVLARFYGTPKPWWAPAHPNYGLGGGNLVFEARLSDDDWIVTDDTWRTRVADAWTPITEHGIVVTTPIELFDARRFDPSWREPAFDDSSWDAATMLNVYYPGASGRHEPPSDPYGALLPRPIPQLRGEIRDARIVDPVTVTGAERLADPVLQVEADEATEITADGGVTLVTADFGRVVAGLIRLDVDAPAGATFDVSCAESLRADGKLHRLLQHAGFRYVARGGDDGYETFDPIGCRALRIAIRDADGRARVRGVSVRERLYPRPEGTSFDCSDPDLTKIFEIGLRTVDLSSQDAYVDSSREQRAWTGDAVVTQLVHLATNPDWGLAIWDVDLHASPAPDGMLPQTAGGDGERGRAGIVDWQLHWLHALHNLFRYTGERELIAKHLAVAENVLRWFVPYQGPDGLLADVAGWALIDWGNVYTTDTSSCLNALWARGLHEFAEMSEWLGDSGRASWARASWDRVASGFEVFWDERRGGYVDHVVDGAVQRAMSQHATASAIAAGLVRDDRLATAVATMTDRARLVRRSWLMEAMAKGDPMSQLQTLFFGNPPEPDWDVEAQIVEAQPFFRYVVHDAVVRAGRADMLPELCRDWCTFLEAGETTWPESWHGGSHCHGWSATPTRDLITGVLGIAPAEPGFARVRVAPRLGPLEWATGTAPTPFGWVRVDAQPGHVAIDSPVPIELDLGDGTTKHLDAGTHKEDR